MSNYTVLQQNTLAGLSEGAGALYLGLCDVFQGNKPGDGERRAFMAAADYDEKVGMTLDHILHNFMDWALDAGVITQLSLFFSERWRHNFADVG